MKYFLASLFILPLLASCDVVEERYEEPRYERSVPQVEILPPHRHHPLAPQRRTVPAVTINPPRGQVPLPPVGYDAPRGRDRVVVIPPQVQVQPNPRQQVVISGPNPSKFQRERTTHFGHQVQIASAPVPPQPAPQQPIQKTEPTRIQIIPAEVKAQEATPKTAEPSKLQEEKKLDEVKVMPPTPANPVQIQRPASEPQH